MSDKPTMKAAYILAEVGIQPWSASPKEVALAERLAKEHRYIEGAAGEMRSILDVRPRP